MPPYSTPMDVVAETTPAFAWSGPLRVLMVSALVVSPPVSVCSAVKVLVVYVLGMVEDACMYEFTAVSKSEMVEAV